MVADRREAEQAVYRKALDVHDVAARDPGRVAEDRVEDVVVTLPQRDVLRQDEVQARRVLVPVTLGDEGVSIAPQQGRDHQRLTQRDPVHLRARLHQQPRHRMVAPQYPTAVIDALLDMNRESREAVGDQPHTRPDGRDLQGEIVVYVLHLTHRIGETSPADDDRKTRPGGGACHYVAKESHRLRFAHHKVPTRIPGKRLMPLTFGG